MPLPRRWSFVVALLTAAAACVTDASAHPGIHHDIDRINLQLAQHPNCAALLAQRAHLHLLGNDPTAALADAERALSLVPGHREAVLQKGMALSALRRDQEADLILSEYLGCGGTKLLALSERGDVRRRLGRPDEAIADYSAVLARHDVLDVYLARGKLHESIGDLDSAAAGYRVGFERMHQAAALRLALIRVETARGRYGEAVRLIDGALQRSPSSAGWLLRRAEVLETSGDRSGAEADRRRALESATRALRRKPTVLNRCLRAEACLALGMREAALEDIRLAGSASPDDATVRRLQEEIRRSPIGNAKSSSGAPNRPGSGETHVKK